MWILPTDDKVLLALLNSKLGWYQISNICTQIQNGYQLIFKYLRNFIVPTNISFDDRVQIENLVETILSKKRIDVQADTQVEESAIDALVYGLFGIEDVGEKLLIEGK